MGQAAFRVRFVGAHFFNLFFIFKLIRSGLSILGYHPRFYWNDDCSNVFLVARRAVLREGE